MIRGYVSSDDDDSDDYDFGYSDELVFESNKVKLPDIQSEENKETLNSVLKESEKIELFLRAVDRTDVPTLEKLIKEGVSVDCTDDQGWSALLKACGMGNLEVIEFLLGHGANPNKHRELLTPLITCCNHSLVEEEIKLNCVRVLLQHGASVNAKDKFHTTALMYAADSGYTSIVTELLSVPDVNVSFQDKDGWNALFYAVKSKNLKSVEKLIAAGTDLELKDKYKRTVLNLALDKNLIDIAKALGYVEETSVVPSRKQTLAERFLKELPDSKGQGGFFTDAQEILHEFNQLNVKKISLPDLLNATEQDLREIGVKLRPERLKILSEGIHRYHLHPWRSSSMHQITPATPMSLTDAIIQTGTCAKHLVIANASLRYLSTRISSKENIKSRGKSMEGDLKLYKELILKLASTFESVCLMETSLKKIQKQVEQIKPGIPPDYIYTNTGQRRGKRWLWWFVGGVVTGFLIYFKSDFRLIHHHILNLLFKTATTFSAFPHTEGVSVDDYLHFNLEY